MLSPSEHEDVEEAFDEVEASCKLEEYKLTMHREIHGVKLSLLNQAAEEWSKRLNNTMLEQIVLLDRIDALCAKIDKIGAKLEIQD